MSGVRIDYGPEIKPQRVDYGPPVGVVWDARISFANSVNFKLSAPTPGGCQRLIDRIIDGDWPGGV